MDTDTFVTTLYVMADDFCKARFPERHGPGRRASLSCGEVVTLAMFSQWALFGSERGFWRYADRHLREAFPRLPHLSQLNRLIRQHTQEIAACSVAFCEWLGAGEAPYEAMDATAAPTRNLKRRGRGWLFGYANIGWGNRVGFYEGFHVLVSTTPDGAITGFGFGAASSNDQTMAEEFLALRHAGGDALASVGHAANGYYVADKGFQGREKHLRWKTEYGATVYSPTQRNHKHTWPKGLRRWLSGARQIVETAIGSIQYQFRLWSERPHALTGFSARLAAKIAMHNFCMWLNDQINRPKLSFADLIAW